MGGSRLIGRLIDFFSSHAEPMLSKGVEAFDAGDLEGLRRAVHSVKSSAGNLGAREVQNLAEKIEQLAVEKKCDGIQPLLTGLQEAFARAKRRLEDVKKGLEQ